MRLPVAAGSIRTMLREVESSGRGKHVLAVGGTTELASVLRQQFLRGRAEPEAVRFGTPERADVYVHVLAGEVRVEDEAMLRRASRARVPVIAVFHGVGRGVPHLPYVLATDVVRVRDGGDFPLEEITRAIAARLGEDAAPLAARIPLLREAVCSQLVSSISWKNGARAAATWIPGADLPVLALHELRLVSRLAQVYGLESGRELVPEFAATLAAAFGLRALARELLDLVPFAGWAVKAGLAYTGTRALGEAARKRFAPAATLPRAAASPAAP